MKAGEFLSIILSVAITLTSIPVSAQELVIDAGSVLNETISGNDTAIYDEEEHNAEGEGNPWDAYGMTEEEYDAFLAKYDWAAYLEKYPNEAPVAPYQKGGLKANPFEEDTLIHFDTQNVSLPAKFDQRSYNRTTSVKKQSPYGTCWAFASVAAMESSLIALGITNNTVDLSELHLIYNTYRKYSNGVYQQYMTFEQFMDKGFDTVFYSPVVESRAPYTAFSSGKDITTIISDDLMNSYDYEIGNIYKVNIHNIPETKQIIREFGGASISLYMYESFSSPYGLAYTDDYYDTTSTPSYYFPNEQNTNHCVEVVGWDDNYPADAFKTKPAGNGAWLIKNSYGTGSYRGCGYFWLSYYDKTVHDGYAVEMRRKGATSNQVTLSSETLESYPTIPVQLTVNKPAGTTSTIKISCSSSSVDITQDTENTYNIVATRAGNYTIKVAVNQIHSTDDYWYNFAGQTNTRQEIEVPFSVTIPSMKINRIYNQSGRANYTNGAYQLVCNNSYKVNAEIDDILGIFYGTTQDYTITSSNPSVVKVEEDGSLSALKYGKATLAIKNNNTLIPSQSRIDVNVISEGFTITGNLYVDTCIGKTKSATATFTATTNEGVDITNKVKVPEGENAYRVYNGTFTYNSTKEAVYKQCPLTWSDGVNTFTENFEVTIIKHDHTTPDLTITKSDGLYASYSRNSCSECGTDCDYMTINPIQYQQLLDTVFTVKGSYLSHINGVDKQEEVSLSAGKDYTVTVVNGYYQIDFLPECEYYAGSVSTYIFKPEDPITDPYTDYTDPYTDPNAPTDNNATPDPSYIEVYDPATGTYYYFNPDTDNNANNNVSQPQNTNTSQNPTVKPVKPAKPTISSVKSKASKKLTIKWKKAKNAKRYQVQVATNKSFTKNVKTKYTSGRSITMRGLKKGETYYVRVRAINGYKCGKWSAKKSQKVK